jgi:two-component system alkaline phosphatase synthesis response regulator PhoP
MLTKTKILTITRDPVLAGLLQQELNDGEYETVNTKHTGTYLKEVLDAEQPAFIILDIVMPTLDGIGICLQLRQWTQTPIMMLSTWDTGDGKVRGLNLGADNYLTEPFGIDTLKTRIGDTLKRNTAAIDPLANFHTNKN